MESLPGIGRVAGRALRRRGYQTVGDLLWLLPRRYDDQRTVTPLAELEPGHRQVTTGRVRTTRTVPGRKRRLEVVLEPPSQDAPGKWGRLRLVWFKVPRGLADRFTAGQEVTVAGEVTEFRGSLSMAHPEVVPGPDRAAGLVARYPEVAEVPPKSLERAMSAAVARAAGSLPERVPAWVREAEGLPTLAEAVRALHEPSPDLSDAQVVALREGRTLHHRRLGFEELFLLELLLQRRRMRESRTRAKPLVPAAEEMQRARASLPFALTSAQRQALEAIVADLEAPVPMRRLLQGDVGSGKTAVAMLSMAHAVHAGAQVAFLAPTELLVEQHARVIGPWAERLGLRVGALSGSTEPEARRALLQAAARGEVDVIVGTHALLSQSVTFPRLRLAIVDEQHRFGVAQRLDLVRKGSDGSGDAVSPHLLVMTATPIPRSLALVLYGDLDVTVIDDMPPGRVPPVTRAYTEADRERALHQVDRALEAEGAAYVVVPSVDASAELDLPGVEPVYWEMVERYGGGRVAMVHGRMPAGDRQQAMRRFARGDVRVLVTTTVIEVGTDVPHANVVLVDRAERFGLTQLHQLRGRVGRAGQRSACLLVHRAATEEAEARMRILCETHDGFRIAEEDLRLRGPGELFGRRQSGLAGLRFVDLREDLSLLERARSVARDLLERDPALADPAHAPARRAVATLERSWGEVQLEEAG